MYCSLLLLYCWYIPVHVKLHFHFVLTLYSIIILQKYGPPQKCQGGGEPSTHAFRTQCHRMHVTQGAKGRVGQDHMHHRLYDVVILLFSEGEGFALLMHPEEYPPWKTSNKFPIITILYYLPVPSSYVRDHAASEYQWMQTFQPHSRV